MSHLLRAAAGYSIDAKKLSTYVFVNPNSYQDETDDILKYQADMEQLQLINE